MISTRERIAAEVDGLVSEGRELLEHVRNQDPANVVPFAARYHIWYTRGLAVVKNLVADRLDEFRRQYERNEKRKVLDQLSYVIEDYLHGLTAPLQTMFTEYEDESYSVPSFDVKTAAFNKLNNQIGIISSSASRLTDILANIRGVLQADLFDSELDAARHLLKNGHVRAAGAVAGVVLEGHLAEVCRNHSVPIGKKDPHIGDFNDALKNEGIFDVAQWRLVQRLGDIRNLCDHKKQRDPAADEVDELVGGTDKVLKTLT